MSQKQQQKKKPIRARVPRATDHNPPPTTDRGKRRRERRKQLGLSATEYAQRFGSGAVGGSS